MDFAFSPQCEALRSTLLDFMDTHVYPAEAVYHEQMAASADPHAYPPVFEGLKARLTTRFGRGASMESTSFPVSVSWTLILG